METVKEIHPLFLVVSAALCQIIPIFRTVRNLKRLTMAEKYYGTSPYTFCNNNPINFVDLDGEAVETVLDVISIGVGVKNLVKNIKAGNTRAAIGDGIGIVVDVAAAALPFIPGGVGAARAGAKVVNAVFQMHL